METKKILEADYLDLVFNNRNKAYGGYELRKHYGRRTLKALGITMTLLVGGIGAPFILSGLHAKTPGEVKAAEKIIPVTTITDIKPPPAPPKPPKPPVPPVAADPAPPPVAPSLKNLPPVIVPPEHVEPEDTPPTADELKDKLSAAAHNPGQPDGIAAAFSSDKPVRTGSGFPIGEDLGSGGGNKRSATDTFTTVEQMPEFPGGQEGLMAYLRKNVRYPQKAVEVDIQGRVMISFVVNAKGMVEGAKVMRGIGGGCNEEALRVVNAMPKWKPGKQNGQAVKVYYTLPVSFKLM